jgi:hypothetical protein
VTFTIHKLFLPPLVTKAEDSIPEGNLLETKKEAILPPFFGLNFK